MLPKFCALILCVSLIFHTVISIAPTAKRDDESFSYELNPKAPPHRTNWKCFACTLLATVLKTAYFSSQSQDCLAAIVAKVCTVFGIENSQICDAISTQYRVRWHSAYLSMKAYFTFRTRSCMLLENFCSIHDSFAGSFCKIAQKRSIR